MEINYWPIVILILLASGPVCAEIAMKKGRNYWGWWWLGFMFGPIAVLVIAATSSQLARDRDAWADELTILADLRDRGALTDGEFEAQKAKMLR